MTKKTLKQLLLLLLTFTAVICLAFAVTACDGNSSGSSTCDHVYENYAFDINEHWLVCSICGDEDEHESHTINNGVCSVCGAIFEGSDGLEYSLSEDGTYYSVSGIGTCTDTDIVIPSFYDNLLVKAIDDYAFNGCTFLSNITISDSVTSIGWYAFTDTAYYDNESNWEDGVLYIGKFLIRADSSISGSYSIKEGTTVIAGIAFVGCTSLTGITIPDSVKYIGRTAFGNSSFSYVTGLRRIYLEEVHITDLVAWCNISFADEGSSPLDGSNFARLYLNGQLVEDLVIPAGITSVCNYAFYGCGSLKSVIIPDSVMSIGDYAFSYCRSLTSITIPDSVTTISNRAFYNCTKLTSITLPDSLTAIGDFAFCLTSLTSITIPNNVKSIGDYAFGYCYSLTSVTMGSSVTTIGDYAFVDCVWLMSITIPDSVTTIGDYAFSDCFSLTSITIPDRVTAIGEYAFCYCYSLTSITIGSGVTTIGDFAFRSCFKLVEVYNLTSLTITAGSTDNGYAGYYAKDVYTDASATSNLFTQGDYIFYNENGAYYLIGYTGSDTVLILPTLTVNNQTKSYAIYEYAFYIDYPYGSTKITSITIPDSVTSIGDYAFCGRDLLTSITIGNGVTSIGNYAFEDCKSLESLIIGSSVTYIGMFGEISGFDASIYYNGTVSEWSEIEIHSGNTNYLTNATIYYYAESGSTTVAGNYWYYDNDGNIKTWSVE